jgi:hypothetical protein
MTDLFTDGGAKHDSPVCTVVLPPARKGRLHHRHPICGVDTVTVMNATLSGAERSESAVSGRQANRRGFMG